MLSPVLTNGTITGPFAPIAPSWMCDAVAVMPFAMIFALTVWSALIVTMPEPVAVLLTGGTSLAPDSVISWPNASEAFASIPMAAVAANAMTYPLTRMIPPRRDCWLRSRRRRMAAAKQ